MKSLKQREELSKKYILVLKICKFRFQWTHIIGFPSSSCSWDLQLRCFSAASELDITLNLSIYGVFTSLSNL